MPHTKWPNGCVVLAALVAVAIVAVIVTAVLYLAA